MLRGSITKHNRPMIMWIAMNKTKNSLLNRSATDSHFSDISTCSSSDLPFVPISLSSLNGAPLARSTDSSSGCQLELGASVAVCESDTSITLLLVWCLLSLVQAHRHDKQFLADFTHLGRDRGDIDFWIFTIITCMSKLMPHMVKMMER